MKYLPLLTVLFLLSCSSEPDSTKEPVIEELGWQLKIEWLTMPLQSHSFRGLHVLDENIVWISGTDGIFLTTNDGETWVVDSIPIVSGMDLRDVEAFNDSTAIVMTAGSPGLLLRTTNKGRSWEVVYKNNDSLVFMDGMDFFNRIGYVYGDPLDGKHFLLYYFLDDFNQIDGSYWFLRDDSLPKPLSVEAGFAASGTGIVALPYTLEPDMPCGIQTPTVLVGFGGEKARVLRLDRTKHATIVETPMKHGKPGDGIYSMAFADSVNGIAVGGNWEFEDCDSSKIFTRDGGLTWQLATGVQGYRSGSCYVGNGIFISTGTNGTDISMDWGESWTMLSDEGFNAIEFVPGEFVGYAVGSKGRIAKLTLINE